MVTMRFMRLLNPVLLAGGLLMVDLLLATTYEKRLELGYYYVKHCNILLDIKCVFKTIKAVVFKTGVK